MILPESRTPATGPLEPLHLRRPAWVETAIDRGFRELDSKTYSINGVLDDYFLFASSDTGRSVMAQGMVAQLAEKLGRPIRILDIGAGYGGFILWAQQAGHIAHGLSAHDYRVDDMPHSHITRQLKPGSYIIGDANRLADIPGLEEDYDLVVSQNTFQHLVDPIGSLEQALDIVSVGGSIMIRHINFMNRSDATYEDLTFPAGSFQEAGFALEVEPDVLFIQEALFANRLSAETQVRFPVDFVHDPHSNVQYTWTTTDEFVWS